MNALPKCLVHGYAADAAGLCWVCRDEREEEEARRDRDHYRATAPAELAIPVADGGSIQRFAVPKLRRRR